MVFPPGGWLFEVKLFFPPAPSEILNTPPLPEHIIVRKTFLTAPEATKEAAEDWLLVKMLSGEIKLVEAEYR